MNKKNLDIPYLLILGLFTVILIVAVYGLAIKFLALANPVNRGEELRPLQAAQAVKVKKELLVARPGDIVEFNDGQMFRVSLNPHDSDAEVAVDVHLYVNGIYSLGGSFRVSPWQVRRVYHYPNDDWKEAAQRFVLQGLPDVPSR